ncbi:putative late embryogenesis abundant protein [Zalerion maritima]|uniref:Late embryogenesis abundant protein n=1 Tax=Zalerion maritima TaxID=339359 RepID=A0AAD5WN53_9PEZI|nr:putative late embryogenesis abundant protein [Zalerion maritima]
MASLLHPFRSSQGESSKDSEQPKTEQKSGELLGQPLLGGYPDTPRTIPDDSGEEPVEISGTVSEAGEVIASSGKSVGKVTEGSPSDLLGNLVTTSGSILDGAGKAVGKADILSDVVDTVTYTTKPVTDTVGETAKPVSDTVDETTKPATDAVGKTTEPVEDATKPGMETLGKATDPVTKGVANTTKPLADGLKPATDGLAPITNTVGNLTKPVTDITRPVTGNLTDAAGLTKRPESESGSEAKNSQADLTTQTGKAESVAPENQSTPETENTETDAGNDIKMENEDPTATDQEESLLEQRQVSTEGKPIADDSKGIPVPPQEGIENVSHAPDSIAPGSVVPDDVKEEEAKTEQAGSGADQEGPFATGIEDVAEKPGTDYAATEATAKEEGSSSQPGEQVPSEDAPGSEIKEPTEFGEGEKLAEGEVPAEDQPAEGETPGEEAEAFEEKASIDFSDLVGCKINKLGNVVGEEGNVIGRITSGNPKLLIGRRVAEDGKIFDDSGKVIGEAEPIPNSEREEYKEPAPFEDFPDAVVESNGKITWNGDTVGRLIEGDAKQLKGKHVDPDGDVLDKNGNFLGKAERWEEEPEPEPEPEPEVDCSILAGKRVNKGGNVVDSSGQIYGRVVEGDIKQLIGRMCDKSGSVRSESGDIIGRAELVAESEREGFKDGPFAGLADCTVDKDGKVLSGGVIVGRLSSGDAKILAGRPVDEDGDILDRNGNVLGRAERWDEPEIEKAKDPMSGRKVNREGNIVDENGDIIGKLTTGTLSICVGKEVDDDGDVVDLKGNTIGHVSLLEDIPEPEPVEEESSEEKAEREQKEQDKQLAIKLCTCIDDVLNSIKPVCKMITAKIDKAERTPKEELDEEKLVSEVKPLIEEGGRILTEANGMIRGLDPDGRIAANAKHKTAAREATPEEYRLADLLKELTGTVTECIEGAKRKIEDMPHAKKELNPLWGLLTEPLFQIIAAVGLLLNAVLSIVGRLLQGLGLGGILQGLLGTLGIDKLLDGLGVGGLLDGLKGKKNKK